MNVNLFLIYLMDVDFKSTLSTIIRLRQTPDYELTPEQLKFKNKFRLDKTEKEAKGEVLESFARSITKGKEF